MRKKTVNAVDEKVEKTVDNLIGIPSEIVSDSKKPSTIKKAVDSVAHGAGQAFGQKILYRRMPNVVENGFLEDLEEKSSSLDFE